MRIYDDEMATELALGRADQLQPAWGELATVNDSVCVGVRRRACLNRCRGECIVVLSPTVVEVAVLLVRMIDYIAFIVDPGALH